MPQALAFHHVMLFRRLGTRHVVPGIVALVLLAGCAGTDNSQVASGLGDPIVTTAPLAVPPVLRQPGDTAVPTTAPADLPVPTATVIPTAIALTAVPATTVPINPTPTQVAAQPTVQATSPAAAAPAATGSPATAIPATAVPATAVPAATSAAATAATSAPAATETPVQVTAGAAINLGNFEVVNLVTGNSQNIADLAPSGPTMLWFWAPH